MFAGEATNAALNENRSEFIETLRPIAERTVGEVILEIANKITNNFSLKELFRSSIFPEVGSCLEVGLSDLVELMIPGHDTTIDFSFLPSSQMPLGGVGACYSNTKIVAARELCGKGRSGRYHWSCFFAEHCPASVEDIKDFEVLSWVDRRRIRERIGVVPLSTEFLVDCANADTGICHLCQDKIPERAVRISKKGLGEFHLGCFSNERALLDYQLSSGDMLQGYTQLEAQDQLAVQRALPLVAVLELGPRSEPNWIQLPDTTEVTEVHLHFKNTTLG
uniref:PARP-type domain-containing protein n=1 Tax=Timema poppense TaxID=170557 RepID=A0A7R9H9N2_TIMPO|nr:unnamed protein product [Timema poppensis]